MRVAAVSGKWSVAFLLLCFAVSGVLLPAEYLIPGLAILLCLLVRGMVVRAVNGRADCKANLLRAAAWGVAWATLYTAPLPLTVLAVHAVHPHLHRH